MNVVAMCTVSSGLTAIKFALDMGVKIQKVIGLDNIPHRNQDAISGVIDIASFCYSNDLDFDYVSDYSLKTENPKILGEDIDLIWVCNWQRLLPCSFIKAAKLAVVGSHGSCDGITKGRGRSPQNWALMIGAKKFEISLFKLTLGIDDGEVIASSQFELTSTDTINSSYLKASFLVAEMIAQVYLNPSLLDLAEKQTGEVSYFPKRTPSDGAIDWTMSANDINNQIKALAPPYPNSFSFFEGTKIFIKESLPININVTYTAGEVIETMYDKSFLVACNDGLLHVSDYHVENASITPVPRSKLKSVSINQTANKIYERFKTEFPDKAVNQTLLNFWSRNDVKLT